MDRRYRLIAALLILAGGAIYLWLNPEPAAPPAPSPPAPIPSTPIQPADPSPPDATSVPAAYILAVTWFPGFCEWHPAYTECRNPPEAQNARFALHGLWPEDEYCGVSDALRNQDDNGWNSLPAVELSKTTWAALRTAMPGTVSNLERHEWLKHGTCSGVSQDAYFRASARLVATLNATAVPDLFNRNLGDTLSSSDIRAAFDRAFGTGSGKRVRISCERLDGHDTIIELTLSLYGAPFDGDSLAKMLAAAPTRSAGCPVGLVNR